MKKATIILLISLLLISLSFAKPYQKKVNGETLKIYAHREVPKGRYIYFYSRPNKKDVILKYADTAIYAKSARLDKKKNKLFLEGDFYSKYMNFEVWGKSLVYNPRNQYFDSEEVTVKSDKIFTKAKSFAYYGERISFKDTQIGVSQIKLDVSFKQLDLYPGWTVAQHVTLKLFKVPFLYAPLIVDDKRRNTYKLPTPLPEIGNTPLRGDYWRENIHFYHNEYFYGNIQFGRANEKGAGYGGQAIIRFSDKMQFNYINENWQYDNTQELFSLEYNFLKMPKKKRRLSFNELLKYNETLAEIPANSLRIESSRFEEINEEVIHRKSEVIFNGNFDLPWHGLKLYNKTSHAVIEEITTTTNATRYIFLNEITRPTDLPWIGPFTPGLGHNNTQYTINPFYWQRTYDFIEAQRKWWRFSAKGRVTDFLSESGNSPFVFDRKYVYPDNVKTEIAFSLWGSKFGRQTQYALAKYRILDIVYFINLRQSSWSLEAEYSKRDEAWSASISITLL